jgi:hypothetical protein
MRNTEDLIFMIEGGKALELVKQHIADRLQVHEANVAMCKELGVTNIITDRCTGNLLGVVFPGERHPDFKVPGRNGDCYPKKNTEWAKRLADAPRYRMPTEIIHDELGVPCSLSYTSTNGAQGWTCIGSMMQECGFLYLGEHGPYAMWIPNVPAEVALIEEDGKNTVDEPARSFVPEFEGCRLIEAEEWEILVAQHKLEKKRKQTEGATA